MPSVWMRHKNTRIQPFELHYSGGQTAESVAAAYADEGWSAFDPNDKKLQELRGQAAPVSVESPDSQTKEK